MAVTRRGEGAGSPSQELKHFTDRDDVQAVFWEHVDRDSDSSLPVLMYYGVGGMGKTWLLKKLRAGLLDRQVVPSAMIDFEPDAGGASYQRDGAALLAAIWRQLGVECPRFELAYSMMRFKQGAGDKPLLRHSGKASAAWELVAEGGNALLNSLPGGNLIVWLGKKIGETAATKLQGTALCDRLLTQAGQEDYVDLGRKTDQEIYPLLAARLGEDLDERLPAREGKACRAVVFLDTFEALRVGTHGDARQHEAEKPIRELCSKLTCVLLVIAGRDLLTWEEVDNRWADPAWLGQHLLGGLSRHDASAFLEKCGITPGPLLEAILRVSRDEEAEDGDAYYPFSLGLCADTVVSERHGGQEPDPATFDMAPNDYDKLAQRFLKSLHDRHTELWITSLAQTPRFDEAAARRAFSPVADRNQDAAWETLLDYSFVQETTEPGWYRLHSHMTASLRNKLADDKKKFDQTHAEWQAYWKSRVESEVDDHAALAWFHDWILKPDEAREYWVDLTQRVRKSGKMSVHHDLLDWWLPTEVEGSIPKDQTTAAALVQLGSALDDATLGNRTSNQRRAIACYESALRVYTESDFPADWARTQNNLGIAYGNLPTGDRDANLRAAIACYESALRVRTEKDYPADWAGTQNNLGLAYWNLPTGDRDANLRAAIACYESALRVYTEMDYPADWAMTQNNLGNAYGDLPTGDRDANLRAAIACYESALRVRTEKDYPAAWAMTQNNLGLAYWNLPTGDRDANLRKAIECYESALRVYTESDYPAAWATTQNNLGSAYSDLPTGDRDANLRMAIACYESALRVRTESDYPADWAGTQNNLGNAYGDLQTGDRAANLRTAIACYESALRVRTEKDYPADWAGTQNNLGATYFDLPTGDRAANLRMAFTCFESALRVYTESDYPADWAMTQKNLEIARAELEKLDPPKG